MPLSPDKVKPDPIELQRRYDADKALNELYTSLKEIEGRYKARESIMREDCYPLINENALLRKQRTMLLRKMEANDARIRRLRESAAHRDSKMTTVNSKIKERKAVIRARYVQTLMIETRKKFNEELKAGPPPMDSPEPATEPTEQTTP